LSRNELNAYKKRDPYFDNARFILVALVVLGHLISPARHDSDIIFFANNYVGSFRMPALVLITGFFSKRFNQEGFYKKITLSILIPYLIFQCFYSVLNDVIYGHEEIRAVLLQPSFAMWFLLSLFFWNFLLPVFTKFKHPITISLFIGVGIGWLDSAGHYLSISRTFVFFPFFLIGHYLKSEHFNWFRKKFAKVVSLSSIGFSWLILSHFSLLEARLFLLARSPYAEIADSYLEGTLFRIIFYIVMMLGVVAVLPWIPKRETFFSYRGRRTAYIYLLHILVIKLISVLELPHGNQLWHFAVIPAVWLLITFATSSDFIVNLTRPLVEGKIANFLFNDGEQSPKQTAVDYRE
jgi:fucose 4-O-acetylase-like acetyltransferase